MVTVAFIYWNYVVKSFMSYFCTSMLTIFQFVSSFKKVVLGVEQKCLILSSWTGVYCQYSFMYMYVPFTTESEGSYYWISLCVINWIVRFSFETVSCSPYWPWLHYILEDNLVLVILCLDYSRGPPLPDVCGAGARTHGSVHAANWAIPALWTFEPLWIVGV